MYVTPFPSNLILSFKKLSQNLRSKDTFLINNHDKDSNTLIGEARILFNNLPYQIRSISNFKSFSREVIDVYSTRHKQIVFRVTSEPIQSLSTTYLLFYFSCFTSNWEKSCFIFHSLLIYISVYIVPSKWFLNTAIYTPIQFY